MPFIVNLLNPPVARPGIYRIRKHDNGKSYVGKGNSILNRKYGHERLDGRAPKLHAALRKYGFDAFIFEPIYILLEPNPIHLSEAETALILEFDCIASGYNIYADNNGPMPADFNDRVRAALNRPDVKARHVQAIRDNSVKPEYRTKLIAAQQRIRVVPGYNEKHAAIMSKISKDPNHRAKIATGIKQSWQDPEIRARHMAARATPEFRETVRKTLDKTGTIWITNGTNQHRIPSTDPIPDGWKKGRGPSGSEVARLGGLGGGWKTRRERYGQGGGAKSPDKVTRQKLGVASQLAQSDPDTKEKHRTAINENWERRRLLYGPTGRRPKTP